MLCSLTFVSCTSIFSSCPGSRSGICCVNIFSFEPILPVKVLGVFEGLFEGKNLFFVGRLDLVPSFESSDSSDMEVGDLGMFPGEGLATLAAVSGDIGCEP